MTILEQQVIAVLTQGPQTARELSQELHVDFDTARRIVSELRDSGAIAIHQVKNRGKGGGSGRPTNVYMLADPR